MRSALPPVTDGKSGDWIKPASTWSRLVYFLAGAAVLSVLLVGLVPYDFHAAGYRGGARVLPGVSGFSSTYPDVIANIFLYVPVGALFYQAFRGTRRRAIVALILTVGLAAGLSGLVETLQAFSALRVSSMVDVVSNVVGASLGAGLSGVFARAAPRVVRPIREEARTRPRVLCLKAYCLTLVVLATAPFSFSLDVSLLKRAGKTVNFHPFRQAAVDAAVSDASSADSHHAVDAFAKWHRMKSWSRWAAECLSFVLLAWLLHRVLRSDYAFGRLATAALVLWLGMGMAIGLSVVQLPIVSRTCDVTDVLFRVLGLAIGLAAKLSAWAWPSRVRAPRGSNVDPGDSIGPLGRLRTMLGWGCVVMMAYIVYVGIIPCTFGGFGSASGPYASVSVLPFGASFMTRFDLMISGFSEEFFTYALFAALVASCRAGGKPPGTHLSGWPVVAAGMLLSALIETAQVFISVRVASVTDTVIAGAGCLSGAMLQRHLMSWYGRVRADIDPGAIDVPCYGPNLSPTDALVASLTDPHPDAPRETNPSRGYPLRSQRM